jgi:HPt (histidine-containing phosphotransfer) domain-containing protein
VLQAGMDDFLTKPIQLAALGQTLDRWAPRARRFSVTKSEVPTDRPPARVTTPPRAPAPAEPAGGAGLLLDPNTPRSDRMCELFVEHSRDDLEFLQEAVAVGDVESLRLRSHRIKGSAFAFGARRFGEKAAELERLAIAGDLNVESHVEELIRLFQQTSALLSSDGRRVMRS